jgi:hypothetical protein
VTRLLPISIASFGLGAILVLIAELADVHETRVFGAALIVVGGLGIGTETGLADPRTFRVPSWLRDWRAVIGVAAGWLALLPVLIVLGMALAGLFRDGGDRNAATLALGAIIVVLMAAAVLAAGLAGLWKIIDAANDDPAKQGASPQEAAEARDG